VVAITDEEYPKDTAEKLLRLIVDEFTTKYTDSVIDKARAAPKGYFTDKQDPLPLPELKEHIQKWQNPDETDPIRKIQRELDETKNVVYKSLEGVLERGEKLESLVEKSDNLSAQSKMFYTQVPTLLLRGNRTTLTDISLHLGEEAKLLLHCHVNTVSLV
jgi:synaptobrevin family protein YKT6